MVSVPTIQRKASTAATVHLTLCFYVLHSDIDRLASPAQVCSAPIQRPTTWLPRPPREPLLMRAFLFSARVCSLFTVLCKSPHSFMSTYTQLDDGTLPVFHFPPEGRNRQLGPPLTSEEPVSPSLFLR